MKDFTHLSRFEETLFGGADWPIQTPHWLIVQLSHGIAYLHGKQVSDELPVGGVVVIPPDSAVTILASTLGEARLRGCPLRIGSLAGLLTTSERMCLQSDVVQSCSPFKRIGASEPTAARLGQYLDSTPFNLAARLGVMHVFAEWVLPWLGQASQKRQTSATYTPGMRLKEFLDQKPESELTDLSLGEVAHYLSCCERHASRVFHEVCGCSFRKYVSELRLKRACQMLVQEDYKIIDVALESGHSSLALFNCNFKSRFRMTPTEWRERNLLRKPRPATGGVPALSF